MKQLPNFHVLKISTLGATNTYPARVKIHSERFQQTVIIPFTNDPAASSPTLDTAKLWLIGKAFDLCGMAEGKDCYYIISNTFQPLKSK